MNDAAAAFAAIVELQAADAPPLVVNSVLHDSQGCGDRMLLLLSFIYPTDVILSTRANLEQKDRELAAKFSFLLSIPVIGAAGAYGLLKMIQNDTELNWTEFTMAVGFSALAGWVCIAAFLALLKRFGLLPFVIYRLALGLALLYISF